MRFAYADPPYLGMCAKYGHEHGDGGCWNDPETHRELIGRLSTDFDGYALSLHLPSLRTILGMVPEDARLLAWCKTFGTMHKAVVPMYAWEPVVMVGARSQYSGGLTPRDWLATFPVKGFFGAKPPQFTAWILACLGVQDGDTFTDLFYGSGAVTVAYESWRSQGRMFA